MSRAYAFFDPPIVLDASVTPIPASGSSPLQVIADTGHVTGRSVRFIDTTGALIGVYVGASGFEQLACVIGGGHAGLSEAHDTIPSNSRISLRAMNNQAVTSGELQAALVNS